MNVKPILAALIFTWLTLRVGAADTNSAAAETNSSQPITVAVYDFSANNGPAISRDVTALFTTDLSTNTAFVMVERAQLKKALGEQAFGLSGSINFDAAAKVGQLTGAKVLVAGRIMKLSGQLVLIANIVGTETSRLFAEKVQGPLNKEADLVDQLSQKVAQTIMAQATNLVVNSGPPRQRSFDDLMQKLKGRHLPSVSVAIKEHVTNERGPHQTAQTELSMIMQKAGFQILDEKSDMRPDVLITGTAMASNGDKQGNFYSCHATLELKAERRKGGDIVAIEHQDSTAIDIGRQTASRTALQQAADDLAEKFLPRLADQPQ